MSGRKNTGIDIHADISRKEGKFGYICGFAKGKMKEKLYKEIIEIFKEVSENGIDEIEMDDILKEKGISSLTFIQMLVTLEERYDFVFDDEMLDMEKLASINAVTDYVLTKI